MCDIKILIVFIPMQLEVIARKILTKQIYFTNIYIELFAYNFNETKK